MHVTFLEDTPTKTFDRVWLCREYALNPRIKQPRRRNRRAEGQKLRGRKKSPPSADRQSDRRIDRLTTDRRTARPIHSINAVIAHSRRRPPFRQYTRANDRQRQRTTANDKRRTTTTNNRTIAQTNEGQMTQDPNDKGPKRQGPPTYHHQTTNDERQSSNEACERTQRTFDLKSLQRNERMIERTNESTNERSNDQTIKRSNERTIVEVAASFVRQPPTATSVSDSE